VAILAEGRLDMQARAEVRYGRQGMGRQLSLALVQVSNIKAITKVVVPQAGDILSQLAKLA
jgi:hypothetical protein